MSSCQDVINRAARKLNVIPLGATLSSDESNNALTILQSVYLELVGWGAFGRENDCMSCGDWTALPQTRIRMNNPAGEVTVPDIVPASIYWPRWWNPSWGEGSYLFWPIWPTGPRCVAPRDLSVVTVVDPSCGGVAHTYIYDAYVGRWSPLDALELTDEAPLSRRWFEPLANILAGRLATDYGQEIPPALQLAISNGLTAMTMRFGEATQPVVSEYC